MLSVSRFPFSWEKSTSEEAVHLMLLTLATFDKEGLPTLLHELLYFIAFRYFVSQTDYKHNKIC